MSSGYSGYISDLNKPYNENDIISANQTLTYANGTTNPNGNVKYYVMGPIIFFYSSGYLYVTSGNTATAIIKGPQLANPASISAYASSDTYSIGVYVLSVLYSGTATEIQFKLTANVSLVAVKISFFAMGIKPDNAPVSSASIYSGFRSFTNLLFQLPPLSYDVISHLFHLNYNEVLKGSSASSIIGYIQIGLLGVMFNTKDSNNSYKPAIDSSGQFSATFAPLFDPTKPVFCKSTAVGGISNMTVTLTNTDATLTINGPNNSYVSYIIIGVLK